MATARELAAAANANIDVDPERSILLALAAVEQSRRDDAESVLPEAEEALHRAVTASHIELRIPGIGGRLDWSPDGTVFATEGPEDSGIVDIRDAQTGETVRSFPGHDGDIVDVAFNHDGTLLATTGIDGAARIWKVATGELVHTVRMPLTDDSWGPAGPSFSHDGSLFAAAWPGEGLVKVIDLASGRIVREIRSVASPNRTIFDPTGARLAITSWEVPTTVVDLASGDVAFALDEVLLYPVMDTAWSPDGQSIATAGFDGGVRVFDGGTGHQRFSIHGTGGHAFAVDWSPDSARLVAGKSDGTARVWIVDEGGAREVITLSAHDTRKGIEGVAFSPDGTRVLTGDLGVTAARVWDVSIDGDAEVANLPAVVASVGAVDFTSDGRQLVASSGAGSVTVWDAQSFTRHRTLGVPSRSPTAAAPDAAPGYLAPLASGADVFSVDVSPDGRLVAVARYDGSVRVWDMETGRDAFTVDAGPLAPPYGTVSWNPDGDLLAIAANDGRTGRATVVDRSGQVVAVHQEEFGIALMGLTFTPDRRGARHEASGHRGNQPRRRRGRALGLARGRRRADCRHPCQRRAPQPHGPPGRDRGSTADAAGLRRTGRDLGPCHRTARRDPGREHRGRARSCLQRRRNTSRGQRTGRHRGDLGPDLRGATSRPPRTLRRGLLGCVQSRRLTARVRGL